MAKRSKKKYPISDRSLERLKKELKKARSRISNLQKRMGASYIGPKVEDFYLENVLNRIQHGTHINTVYAMTRNATAEKIRKANAQIASNPIVGELYGGAPVRQKEYSKLMNAAAKANRVITAAVKEHPENADLYPALLDPSEIMQKVINQRGLKDITKLITQSFTPRKMEIVALNEDGLAGTEAEKEYLTYFIDNENKKREKARKQAQIDFEKTHVLLTQNEFDVRPLNTDHFKSLDFFRRVSNAVTDAADLHRADLWKMNYYSTLEAAEAYLRSETNVSREALDDLQQIYRIIERMEDPSLVRHITRYSEDITIQGNYFEYITDAEEAIAATLEAWLRFEREYMRDVP